MSIYIAGNNKTVLKSVNSGGSWESVSSGIDMGTSVGYITDLLHVKTRDGINVITAGWRATIWQSLNGGTSWLAINMPNVFSGGVPKCIGLDFIDDNNFVCGFSKFDQSHLFFVGQGVDDIDLFDLAGTYATSLSVLSSGRVCVGFENGDVYTTDDRGASWIKRLTLPAVVTAIDFSGTIGYAVSNFGRVGMSLDGGDTWTEESMAGLAYPKSVFVNPYLTSDSPLMGEFAQPPEYFAWSGATNKEVFHVIRGDNDWSEESISGLSVGAQILGITFRGLRGFFVTSKGEVMITTNAPLAEPKATITKVSTNSLNSITSFLEVETCTIEAGAFSTTKEKGDASDGTAIVTVGGAAEIEYTTEFRSGIAINWKTVAGNQISISDLTAGNYRCYIRDKNATSCLIVREFTIEKIGQLSVVVSATNVSSTGANDGLISVNILDGSGNYRVQFDDGVFKTLNTGEEKQSYTRTNLGVGAYEVIVVDIETGAQEVKSVSINEPALSVSGDNYMDVPLMNSVRFIREEDVDGVEIMQTLDNTLFCKQVNPGITQENYDQSICRRDKFTLQWKSNYQKQSVFLYDIEGNELYKYQVNKVRENSITFETYSGEMVASTIPRESNIYFRNQEFPPVNIGQEIEISGQSIFGAYRVVGVDEAEGEKYLIVKNEYGYEYNTDAVTVTISSSSVNYDIYEVLIDNLTSFNDGRYYFKIIGEGAVSQTWVSEPISLKDVHVGHVLIEWANGDPAVGIDWSTGITCFCRVQAEFFKVAPKTITETTRNQDGTLINLRSKFIRQVKLTIYHVPGYLHEKLAVAFKLDLTKVNGVRYSSEGEYSAPEYPNKYPLAKGEIIIEQFEFLPDYNSDDVGLVNKDINRTVNVYAVNGANLIVNGTNLKS